MKKLFFGLILLIILILGGAYTLLFTPLGNGFVASKIEETANKKKGVNFKVNTFVLTTSAIEFDATVDGNSHIKVAGNLDLLARTVDLKYNLNIKDLSKLEKFTHQKFNGSFKTKGTLKGNQKLAKLEGTTDIFKSNTTYDIKLQDFEPSTILLNMEHAKIKEILYLLNQPIYANGNIDINANIKNAKIEHLDGLVKTKITNGIVANNVVNKAFNTKLKALLAFKGDINTKLVPNTVLSKVDFYTTMANIFVKEANVNLKTMRIKSDYLVKIPNLSKLFDVTQTKMRGAIDIHGNIKKDQDLLVNGNSKFLDGVLQFKLFNDDFTATINNVEILKVLHMMYFPEVFTSKSKIALNYNTAKQMGTIKGQLLNGQFKQNKYSTIINNFARFDLTKEVYKSVDLNSNINKKIIKSTVSMKSRFTKINVNPSTINLEKNTIDALVITDIKGIVFDTKISGSLTNPNVKVDTQKLLKAGVQQKAKEEIKKTLKKILEVKQKTF